MKLIFFGLWRNRFVLRLLGHTQKLLGYDTKTLSQSFSKYMSVSIISFV